MSFINNYIKLNKILIKLFIEKFYKTLKFIELKIILYFIYIKKFYYDLIYLINLNLNLKFLFQFSYIIKFY